MDADMALKDPRFGIGGNQGPALPSEDSVDLHLQTEYATVLTRAADLLAAEPRFAIVDTDEADSEATEFMVKVRAEWKKGEAGRVKEKQPYDDMAGRIHAFFKTGVLDPLQKMGERINEAQTQYKLGVLRAENERLADEARKLRAAEEAARKKAAEDARAAADLAAAAARARKPENIAVLTAQAQEAQAKAEESGTVANQVSEARADVTEALAAPAADKTRSRGGRGGVASLVGTTTFRDLDPATIDLEKLRDVFAVKDLEKTMNAWIKANKGAADKAAASIKPEDQPIRGVVIFTDYNNRGRS